MAGVFSHPPILAYVLNAECPPDRRRTIEAVSIRRMTRYKYNDALQDLLGLPWDFAKDLPPEAHSDEGFENSSDRLRLSVSQFETFHRIARSARERATVTAMRLAASSEKNHTPGFPPRVT